MNGHHTSFLDILLLIIGSFLSPLLASRLRVPSAVFLILYGVGLGALSFAPDASGEVVTFLADLGFIILMFMAGLEIDFNSIRKRGAALLIVLTILCLACFGLTFLITYLLGFSLIYGLILGATSVGLPLAILKETGQLRTTAGQFIILIGSIGEFLTIVAMTLYYFLVQHGISAPLFIGLAKLFGILLFSGIVLRLLMSLAWWKPERFSGFATVEDDSEIGVRASMVLMLTFSMMALLAGVEAVIGAFIAGAVLAFVVRGKHIIAEKLATVGNGFFVPIFFIVVGLRFDLSLLTSKNMITAGLLLLVVFTARLLPSLILPVYGLTKMETLSSVALLSAPLTLMIAIATLGHELQQLSDSEHAALVLLAILSALVFPTLFRILMLSEQEPDTPGDNQLDREEYSV